MTDKNKENKELVDKLLEKTVCAFCGKKKCNNECRTDWDIRMLNLQCTGYDLEELDYKVRKATDALYEIHKEVEKQTEENRLCQEGHKKHKPKPAKKAG